MDKHDMALELLFSTEQQRCVEAEKLQRRRAQGERLKGKLEKVHLMKLGPGFSKRPQDGGKNGALAMYIFLYLVKENGG